MTKALAVPFSEVEFAIISGDSTRAEVEEALAHANGGAKSMQAWDHLSRLSDEHGRRHEFLNTLLDLWAAAS